MTVVTFHFVIGGHSFNLEGAASGIHLCCGNNTGFNSSVLSPKVVVSTETRPQTEGYLGLRKGNQCYPFSNCLTRFAKSQNSKVKYYYLLDRDGEDHRLDICKKHAQVTDLLLSKHVIEQVNRLKKEAGDILEALQELHPKPVIIRAGLSLKSRECGFSKPHDRDEAVDGYTIRHIIHISEQRKTFDSAVREAFVILFAAFPLKGDDAIWISDDDGGLEISTTRKAFTAAAGA